MKPNIQIAMILLVVLLPWSTISIGKSKHTGKEMIVNGDFSNGISNWNHYTNNDGSADSYVRDGVLHVSIKSRGRYPWSVGIEQKNKVLVKNNRYRVSFDAWSTKSVNISVIAAKIVPPYNTFSGRHHFKIGTLKKRYICDFTMFNTTYKKGALIFHLGKSLTDKNSAIVFIDNVSLREMGKSPRTVISGYYPEPGSKGLKRGLCLGNTLDAPVEGEWGTEIRQEYFNVIKRKKVFDHVRIPVRWETRSAENFPYTIDPEFMHRVEWAASGFLAKRMHVIINMHHHTKFENNPLLHRDKFLSLWKQIAERFKKYPKNLYLEIYNEPASKKTGDKSQTLENPQIWNRLYVEAYDVIRSVSPRRKIIITVPQWAGVENIDLLVLPERLQKDPDIIVQFHYYQPYLFCFQGTLGNGEAATRVSGVRWTGTSSQKKAVIKLLDHAVEWSKAHNNVRLWNGEFCAHAAGSEKTDRLKWDGFVAQECEKRGIGWCYWDFCNDSARIYDIHTKKWDDDLVKALIWKIEVL